MHKSTSFLLLTTFLTLLLGLLGWYVRQSTPLPGGGKAVNLQKAGEFQQESALLDSLYTGYTTTLSTGNIPEATSWEAAFKRRAAHMTEQFSGSSAPARLAVKLIRNYQVRMVLQKQIQTRTLGNQTENRRLQQALATLEAENQDLKTQHQMVQQALLNLP